MMRTWRCRDRVIELGDRPLIMAILNVTPDSFSDGGRYMDAERAIARGRELVEAGADLIDVGGESTRPGAAPVKADEELRRVEPVIAALAGDGRAVISVDTSKAAVARRALEAGARVVNDITALNGDAGMADLVAETGAGVVLMHMRGTPRTMQDNPRYEDVVREVREFLAARVDAAARRGVDPDCIAVDPGIGFGKSVEHNVALLANLAACRAGGRPLVVGASRKRFLGALTGRDVAGRLAGSLAAAVCAAMHGADVLRVHDVAESLDAVRVAAALRREGHASVD
jgi:dihydropteroate synthase